MKKRFLKIGALALCIIMCLCSIISVSADWEALAPSDSCVSNINLTIRVDGEESGEVTTHMYATAFRIITVNVQDVSDADHDSTYQPANPVYSWAPAVAEWVAANYPDYIDTAKGNAVTQKYIDYYNEDGSPAPEIAPFIDALSAAIKKHNDEKIKFVWDDAAGKYQNSGYEWDAAEGKFKDNGKPLVSSATFGTDNTASIQNLSKGSYIVLVEGGNRIYQPAVANLTPVWRDANADGDNNEAGWYVDTTANLMIKSASVGITKKVSDRETGPFGDAVNAGIGDQVYFNVLTDVPDYTENAISKNFVIRDEMSKGLSLSGEPKVYGVSDTNEATLLTKGSTADYTYSTETNTGNAALSRKFTITLNYNNVSEYETIKVTYGARLNNNAVIGAAGNPNDAFLDYSNNPYIANSLRTVDDEAIVYTYGLDLTKTDNGTKRLAGAIFTLEREVSANNWQTVSFTQDGAVGKYLRDTNGGTDRVETGSGDNLGKLDLRGLDAGRYRLKEVVAPDGYVLLTDYVTFTIRDEVLADGSAGIDGIPDNGTENNTGDTAQKGYIARSVRNSQGFDLPLTGGMGTILFTAGGIVLVAGAVVLLLVANRKKSRRS